MDARTIYNDNAVHAETEKLARGGLPPGFEVEASFLLRTSKLSITQIADRLHFADIPSFSKFFSRLKGHSPREYREG